MYFYFNETVRVTFAHGVHFVNPLFEVRPAEALLIMPTADFPDLMRSKYALAVQGYLFLQSGV